MAKITKEELHKILIKPKRDCDGYELHVRHLWNEKNYTDLFRCTGIFIDEVKDLVDYRNFVDIVQSIVEANREERKMVITFHTKKGWDQFHRAMQEEVERRFGKKEEQIHFVEHKSKRLKWD